MTRPRFVRLDVQVTLGMTRDMAQAVTRYMNDAQVRDRVAKPPGAPGRPLNPETAAIRELIQMGLLVHDFLALQGISRETFIDEMGG